MVTLVTGGGGLLGYSLKGILPEGVFVTSRDCDLRDFPSVRELFRHVRPTSLIHLAAKVGGVKKNALANADLFSDNIRMNTNVLTVAAEEGVPRVISVLSSCAFRVFPERPSNEADLHEGLPFDGNLGYGCAKRMLDIQTKLISKQYGYDYTTLTPVTMYGPNDNWNLEEGHVIASLIHKCFLAKLWGQPLEVWGSGKAVRQFVYSPDVARLLILALETYHQPETFVIAPDAGISVRALVEEIVQVMGFQGPVLFDETKPEGQLIKVILSKKFSGCFPDFKFTPLREGLQKTVEWFMKNYSYEVNEYEHFAA